jgi:hypothetical protein
VSEDIAREVAQARLAGRRLAASSRQFVEVYIDEEELSRTESGPFAYTLTIPQQSHTSHIANTFVCQFPKGDR